MVLLLDIFENILLNAVHHNQNSDIEIQIKYDIVTEDDKNYLRLEFLDNGEGIEDSRKEIIFKRQYKNIREEKGMGLGLSLVAEILDLYEGRIWVEDRIKGDYSKGSNFNILIPQAE